MRGISAISVYDTQDRFKGYWEDPVADLFEGEDSYVNEEPTTLEERKVSERTLNWRTFGDEDWEF